MATPSPKQRRKRKPRDPAAAEQRRFARIVKSLFTNMGFVHIPTEGKEAKFGVKTGELDSVFVYENVLLIVEETTSAKAFDHAKGKRLLAEQIEASKDDFIKWIRKEFPEYDEVLCKYSPKRFQIFFLYISKNEMNLSDDDQELLSPMRIVNVRAFNYFEKLAKTIRRSAKTDFWRFLDLSSSDIGAANASNSGKTIDTTIISPDDNTGFSNGVRLVSFMISADVLLRNSYVLRKDNWGYAIDLYQRMIDSSRIQKIRRYVATEGSAFLNNIIIGLPHNVTFQTGSNDPIGLDQVQDYSAYRMTIPDEFNSLCIIDGQHRVFAHYEGVDDLEPKVAAIRGKVHLLATGVIFPAAMTELERLQLQSEIFLDINSNTKPVPADVLLAIQSLRAPSTDVAVARSVLGNLNTRSAFKGMFQLSQMDQAPIKIASIVKFALRYLVDIKSDSGLFVHWAGKDASRLALRKTDDAKLLEEYVQFCGTTLDQYFGALKKHRKDEWVDPSSRITSTTVINAMIIGLRRSLPALGVLSFDQYGSLMEPWKIDFSKGEFKYASSQYARFSQEILRDVFGLTEDGGNWIAPR